MPKYSTSLVLEKHREVRNSEDSLFTSMEDKLRKKNRQQHSLMSIFNHWDFRSLGPECKALQPLWKEFGHFLER